VVSNAKWQSWKQLGDMPAMEAMRLYVRTLEEEVSGWWTPEVATAWAENHRSPQANGGHKSDMPNGHTEKRADSAATNSPAPIKSRSVAEVVVEGSWVSPYIASDRRPPPRYEQAVALVGNSLYVIGGNCGGRYLNDTWALNLENLTWKCIVGLSKDAMAQQQQQEPSQADAAPLLPPGLPGLAGHAAVAWNGNVLSIGGHCRAKDPHPHKYLPVRLLDTTAGAWSALKTLGATKVGEESPDDLPAPRGGHSATLIGTKVYIIGGEDAKRKVSDEIWTLDLGTLAWEKVDSSGAYIPPPRSAHSAVSYRNRYIVVFGGGSVATCFNDFCVFDTQRLEWMCPVVVGPRPPPRAGHAASMLGSTLYVVGGGNFAKGCADMYSLDLSPLGNESSAQPLEWVLVGNTPSDSAIASEGLSLLSVPMAGCMVSFGGYNGKYHNAVHVYRPEGFVVVKPGGQIGTGGSSGTTGGSAGGRQGGTRGSSSTSYTEANGGSGPSSVADNPKIPSRSGSTLEDVEAARRETAATKEAVALEVSIMRRQLDSATAALSVAERAAEEVREVLAGEQQRSMQLEVEVAELRQRLLGMADLEKELARYRLQASSDQESKKPGLWGYITGSDTAA